MEESFVPIRIIEETRLQWRVVWEDLEDGEEYEPTYVDKTESFIPYMLIQEWYKSQLHVDSIERSAASTGPFNSAAEIPPRKLSSNELWDDNSILPLEARASFETRQDLPSSSSRIIASSSNLDHLSRTLPHTSTRSSSQDNSNEEVDPFEQLAAAKIELSRNRPIPSTSQLPEPSMPKRRQFSRSSEELRNNSILAQKRRSRQGLELANRDFQRHQSAFFTISPANTIPIQIPSNQPPLSSPYDSSLPTCSITSIENSEILAPTSLRSPQRFKEPSKAPLPLLPPPINTPSRSTPLPFLPVFRNIPGDDRWASLNFTSKPLLHYDRSPRSTDLYSSQGRDRSRSRGRGPSPEPRSRRGRTRSRTRSRSRSRSPERSRTRSSIKIDRTAARAARKVRRKAKIVAIEAQRQRRIERDDKRRRKESDEREANRLKTNIPFVKVELAFVAPIAQDLEIYAEDVEMFEDISVEEGELEEGEVREVKRVRSSQKFAERSKNMLHHPDSLIRDSQFGSQLLDYGTSAPIPSQISSPHLSSYSNLPPIASLPNIITESESSFVTPTFDSYPSPSPSLSPTFSSAKLVQSILVVNPLNRVG